MWPLEVTHVYISAYIFILPGTRLLGELLDHCRESTQKDDVSAYNSLQSFFVFPTPSASRTLYLLEVMHTWHKEPTFLCMYIIIRG